MNQISTAYIIDSEDERREASAKAVTAYLGVPVQSFESATEAGAFNTDPNVIFVVNMEPLDENYFGDVSSESGENVSVIVTTCRNAFEAMDGFPKEIKRRAFIHCPAHKTRLPHHQKIRNALTELGLLN